MSIREIHNTTDLDYWLEILHRGALKTFKLNDRNEEQMHQLVQLTDSFEPVYDNPERVKFCIHEITPSYEEYRQAERGEIEPEEYAFCEVSDDDLKERYGFEVPEGGHQFKWYAVDVIHRAADDRFPEYTGVFINNRLVLAVNDPDAESETDASDLIEYLIDKTKEVRDSLKQGTYNQDIKEHLPCSMRYGIISRKQYWDILPSARKDFRSGLNEEEINRFIACAHAEEKADHPDHCISVMTARKYFEAVGTAILNVSYKERKAWRFHETKEEYDHYKGTLFDGTTPREIYTKFADGRDDGLTNVPLDDADAFYEWRLKKGPYYVMNGSHPWEVRPSFSISRSIHIYPQQVYEGRDLCRRQFGIPEDQWYFLISGNDAGSSYEVVKYYLALKDHDIPVMIYNIRQIARRYEETDYIGILPVYEYMLFSSCVPKIFAGMDVTDTEFLDMAVSEAVYGNSENDEEKRREVKNKLVHSVQWLPEEILKLRKN